MTINTDTGLISGTVQAGTHVNSPYRATVTARHGTIAASQTFYWSVTPHIVVMAPGNRSNAVNDAVSLQITASDPDGHTLTYSASNLPLPLTINSDTGLISGTIGATADSGSPYTVTVTASGGGFSASQRFTWRVTHVLVVNPGDQASTTEDVVSLPITARDGAGHVLTYEASNLPPGLMIGTGTGLISGTINPTALSGSPYSVTVRAYHDTQSDSQTFSWAVTRHVAMSNPGSQHNVAGDTVSLQISAGDPQGDTLAYGAQNLPPNLNINTTTGLIFGTISPTADSGSPYTVTVTASDGPHTSSETFTWTVAHLGITPPGDQSSGAGTTVSLQIQARDAAGHSLSYSATNLPPPLNINSSGLISGTISPTAHTGSPYAVTVTAFHGTVSTSQQFLWRVSHINVTRPANQTSVEGAAVSLQVAASDPDGHGLTYSAGGLLPGLSINSSTGLIAGTIAAGAALNSPYTVTAAASDGALSTSQAFVWTVTPHVTVTNPGDRSGLEGATVSLQVQATDTGGHTLPYSADDLPTGLNINTDTGLIFGTIATAASRNSPFVVTVNATDGTYSGRVVFIWSVTHAANQPPVLTNPGSRVNQEGDMVSLQLVASDPDGDTLNYSATGLPNGLYLDRFSGLISGILPAVAARSSISTVTVTADDRNGAAVSQVFTWTINNGLLSAAGVAVSATEARALTDVPVATFTDSYRYGQPSDYQVTINWGDGTAIDSGSVDVSGTSFRALGRHRYGRPGSFSVSVTITDSAGGTVTAPTTATVAAASLAASGLTFTAIKGVAFTAPVATFTDNNADDPIGSYSAVINWGDGTTTPTTPSSGGWSGSRGTFVVSATKSYATKGTRTITVTITDKDGSQVTAMSTVTVGDVFEASRADLTVATFRADPVGSPSASISWGDGTPTESGTVVPLGAGQFAVTGSHFYYRPADSTVAVTFSDSVGCSIDAESTATVADAPLTAYASNFSATAGSSFTGQVGVYTNPDPTDPHPSDPTSGYAASVDWADGTTSSANILGAAGLFRLEGSRTYAGVGLFPVGVKVFTSTGALTVLALAQAQVAPATKPAIKGPAVVPGLTQYFFEITIDPIPVDKFDYGQGWVVDDNTAVTLFARVYSQAGGNVIALYVPARFSNVAKRVQFSLSGVKLNGAPLKVNPFTVDIVQVEIIDPTPTKEPLITPSARDNVKPAKMAAGLEAPFTVKNPDAAVRASLPADIDPWDYEKYLDLTDRKESGMEPAIGVDTAPKGPQVPAVAGAVKVVLKSPQQNPNAFKRIQVGFIQTVKRAGKAVYDNGGERVFKYAKEIDRPEYQPLDWLQLTVGAGGKVVPVAGNEWPWYPGTQVLDPAGLGITWRPSADTVAKTDRTLLMTDSLRQVFPERLAPGSPNQLAKNGLSVTDTFVLHVTVLTFEDQAFRRFSQATMSWRVDWGWPAETTTVQIIDARRGWKMPDKPFEIPVNVVPAAMSIYAPFATWDKR